MKYDPERDALEFVIADIDGRLDRLERALLRLTDLAEMPMSAAAQAKQILLEEN